MCTYLQLAVLMSFFGFPYSRWICSESNQQAILVPSSHAHQTFQSLYVSASVLDTRETEMGRAKFLAPGSLKMLNIWGENLRMVLEESTYELCWFGISVNHRINQFYTLSQTPKCKRKYFLSTVFHPPVTAQYHSFKFNMDKKNKQKQISLLEVRVKDSRYLLISSPL